ncbi:discoidin domain-containing protein [Paenibacillus methanolicus]|uniref:F5/8 type C domain-containing protein n=1 Tax=Paenibacillus methanolicus TaxID=582686 RepID=A0A5S5C5Z4_9BACL|nr:discoidin domain-containing protein [Paenibacillus methanolicus]TYP74737.1 F5/8 type C domain-containing protein [Paenibacillus methanolicus]
MTFNTRTIWLAILSALLLLACAAAFATAPVKAATVNLALGKAVTVSSTENAQYGGANAVDGSTATRWSSIANDQQYIIVDLGATRSVSSVVLKWEAAYAKGFQIQTSNDNATWTTVYSNYNGTGGTNTITFNANVRYVKMYAFQRATAYGYSLYEFEIYGEDGAGSGGGNLALGRPVSVATTEDATKAASYAVDGSTSTRWSSAYADQQYITVDLGSQQTVAKVVLRWELAYAKQFQVQTSADNVSWTTVYSNYNGTGGVNSITFSPVTARYVKVYLIQRATAYGFSLYELEAYASASGGTGGVAAVKQRVLDYLYGISGNHTIVGIENKNAGTPTSDSNTIASITGRTPSLWGGDFGFGSQAVNNRWNMINEAKNQFNKGALVTLMYHPCAPTRDEYCSWDDIGAGNAAKLTSAQFTQLTTPGTSLYNAWIGRLDTLATYLQDLENNNVVVLFRPFHEMNQCVFWWACHKGANGTAKLYQITHDYLVNTKGLENLIWVWNVQDFSNLSTEIDAYNPGSAYFDIASLDVYNTGYTQNNYNTMLRVSAGKPIAIGECQFMPSASLLASQNKWIYAMLWPDFIEENRSSLPGIYGASNVLTLDEMPGWN